MNSDARKKYGDIIDHPHYVSPDHPQMTLLNRAAQFSPFAALTGYDDLIEEAARETDVWIQPDESARETLDRRLRRLLAQPQPAEAAFTYFVPDEKKTGGAYRTVTAGVRKYDPTAQSILLTTGEVIPLEYLADVEELL